MKAFWFASSTLCAAGFVLAGGASAATPAPADWTSCYLGAKAGAGWVDTRFADTSGANNFAPAGSDVKVRAGAGAVGGFQAGCDRQLAARWVLGMATDVLFSDIKGSAADPFFSNKNFSTDTHFLGSITGRVGYTNERWMIYGLGGLALAGEQYGFSSG